jgi:opacity protein-like surface antigen
MKRNLVRWGMLVLLAAVLAGPATAAAADFDFSKFNGELGLRFAYGMSDSGPDVRFFSLLPRWGLFIIRPGHSLLGGVGLSFVLEGIVSVAWAEDTGAEVGITPLFKVSLPLGRRVLLFVEGGAGLISESFDSPAIAHSFNFTPQAGGGLEVALASRWALCLAYRFRHSSNAGLYSDNPDFNCHFFQAGLTYYY